MKLGWNHGVVTRSNDEVDWEVLKPKIHEIVRKYNQYNGALFKTNRTKSKRHLIISLQNLCFIEPYFIKKSFMLIKISFEQMLYFISNKIYFRLLLFF